MKKMFDEGIERNIIELVRKNCNPREYIEVAKKLKESAPDLNIDIIQNLIDEKILGRIFKQLVNEHFPIFMFNYNDKFKIIKFSFAGKEGK